MNDHNDSSKKFAFTEKIINRFWAKITKTDECWIWTGCKIKGYGRFGVNGQVVLAHRFAYELRWGSFCKTLDVCHNCPNGDNPSCVRPSHLFLGTHLDNMRDAAKKGQMHPGVKCWNAKLNPSLVKAIRASYDNKLESQYNLAKRFNISRTNIAKVVRRETWKTVG